MVSLWPKPTPASYSNPLDPRFRAYGVRPQSPFHTNHPLQPDALEPAPLLTLGKDSRFWMARPRLGLNGVSGLETLKAGNYIAVDFGAGKSTRCFTGLGHAPKIRAETPGR